MSSAGRLHARSGVLQFFLRNLRITRVRKSRKLFCTGAERIQTAGEQERRKPPGGEERTDTYWSYIIQHIRRLDELYHVIIEMGDAVAMCRLTAAGGSAAHGITLADSGQKCMQPT
jgi:hypothetical protein